MSIPGSGDVSFCGVVLNNGSVKRQSRKVLVRRGIGSWPLAFRIGTFEG